MCYGSWNTWWIRKYEGVKFLKFEEVVNGSDKSQWLKDVDERFFRFEKNKCFEPVEINKVNQACTITTITLAMKKQVSGKFRAILNARG